MTSTVPDPVVAELFRRPHRSGETAWAVVADGGRARIFERTVQHWHEVAPQSREIADPPSRDWGSDRPGRTHDSHGEHRHGIEPHGDPHEDAKKAFAAELAESLESAAATGRFQALYLVAPARFLGYLRAALGPAAQARVAGSITSDLAHAPADQIAEALSRHLDAGAA